MSIQYGSARLPEAGFIRLATIIGSKDAPGVFPVSKTTWYQGIRDGRYPPPVKHGRCSLWRVAEIRELIARLESAPVHSSSTATAAAHEP